MFSEVVCLLVDKRWGRRKIIQNQVRYYLGIKPRFFVVGNGEILSQETYDRIDTPIPATIAQSGEKWLRLPHSYNAFLCFQEIVRAAKQLGQESILLLEDDAIFVDDFSQSFERAKSDIEKLEIPWDIFYLGGSHRAARTLPLTENLFRVNGTACFHGVALRNTVYDSILNLPMCGPIDFVTAQCLHSKCVTVAAWPNLIIQTRGWSFCEERRVCRHGRWFTKGRVVYTLEELGVTTS